jgi:hypothetical protein
MVGPPVVDGGKVWGVFHFGGIGVKLLAFDAAGNADAAAPRRCARPSST